LVFLYFLFFCEQIQPYHILYIYLT